MYIDYVVTAFQEKRRQGPGLENWNGHAVLNCNGIIINCERLACLEYHGTMVFRGLRQPLCGSPFYPDA